MHKLEYIYINKLQNNDCLSINDLKQFSKIRLNTNKKRKKFNKNHCRYVTKEVDNIFMRCILAYPISRSFKHIIDFPDIQPIEAEGLPKCELVFIDYKYKE